MIRVLQETLQEIHVVLQAPSPIVGSMPKSWKPGNMPKTKNGKNSSFFCGLLYYLVVAYWLLINLLPIWITNGGYQMVCI